MKSSVCSIDAVTEGKLHPLHRTLSELLSLAPPPHLATPPECHLSGLAGLVGFAVFYVSVLSLLCAVYAQIG